jgi:hypothetical protein
MATATPDITFRELNRRSSDGIDVQLLWSPLTDQVLVAVYDSKTGDAFGLRVAPADAQFAFDHPYAYASSDQNWSSVRGLSIQ